MEATYRIISPTFWTDPKVDEDFTPEDKFFYLYLLTNPHTNICGCYEIGVRQMARDTGYNEETIKHLVNRMETVHKVIQYDRETKEVLIYNWGKYNWTKSDKLKKGVEKVAVFIKSDAFRSFVLDTLNGESPQKPPTDTLSIPYPYPMDTSVSVSDSVSGSVSDHKYTDDFEIFWHEYPKKVGKKEAFKAFKRVKEPLSVLIAAVRAQEQSAMWNKENGRFIPNPATWLNQGRWDDMLPKEKNPFDFMEVMNDNTGNSTGTVIDILNL